MPVFRSLLIEWIIFFFNWERSSSLWSLVFILLICDEVISTYYELNNVYIISDDFVLKDIISQSYYQTVSASPLDLNSEYIGKNVEISSGIGLSTTLSSGINEYASKWSFPDEVLFVGQ